MDRRRKKSQPRKTIAAARVRVGAPLHLCRVQRTTRALCRSAGFSEPSVFQAVIAVTDFAYRLWLEGSRDVDLTLSALRHAHGLELLAENAASGGLPPDRVSLPFAR